MQIVFDTPKLARVMSDDRSLAKQYGPANAQRIRRRLDDLDAASNLEEMRHLPGRCHELTGDRRGQLAIDLVHPLRFIFEPDHDPLPQRKGGGLDWAQITQIKVLDPADYH